MKVTGVLGSSFRDPSGCVLSHKGEIHRVVNQSYADNYELLIRSGLYDELNSKSLLVSHVEINNKDEIAPGSYRVLKPTRIPFVSYPCEWCFSQLKDAALLTLKIAQIALAHDMILKDASAYNVQFYEGKPIFIDTLSFERWDNGSAWIAYRQFCRHFLAPLSLISYKGHELSKLSQIYIDGVPLDLASRLLPIRTKLSASLLMHIHLHAKSEQKLMGAEKSSGSSVHKVSKSSLLGLYDSLMGAITKLTWNPGSTEWGDYYSDTNYSEISMTEKEDLVAAFLIHSGAKSVWDLGANTGRFSRTVAKLGCSVVSFDLDPIAIEKNYREVKSGNETNLLPLILDLTNPTPSYGWASSERDSLSKRGPVDCVLALALVHHLAISNNVPFNRIFDYFKTLGEFLIIEFVPKDDSQVLKLLSTREDIFPQYTKEGFEFAFSEHYRVVKEEKVGDSLRTLYLLKRL